MRLQDIMAKKIITATGDETVAQAARKMREANIGCLVITNAGSVEGIITDRDLTINCLSESHDALRCEVSYHMSSPVITAEQSMDMLEAAHLMTERKVKRLPVVEGNRTGRPGFVL